jgi:hypothetical protein
MDKKSAGPMDYVKQFTRAGWLLMIAAILVMFACIFFGGSLFMGLPRLAIIPALVVFCVGWWGMWRFGIKPFKD